MKKNLFITSLLMLCCAAAFSASWKYDQKKPVPEWVVCAADGDYRSVASALDLDGDEYKIFVEVERATCDETYDMAEYAFLRIVDQMTGEISRYIGAENDTLSGVFYTEYTTYVGMKSRSGSSEEKQVYETGYVNPKTDEYFPYCLMEQYHDGTAVKTYYEENFDLIVSSLKRNSVVKSLFLEDEFYIFLQKDASTGRKEIVASNPDGICYSDYDEYQYYCVYSLPQSVFQTELLKALSEF